MIVMLVAMIATALVLQGLFDKSDHEKSERVVRSYRGAGGATVEERVAKEAPGGAWSTEITQGCRGIVRVTYSAPAGVYVFDYDVPEHRIHPGNAAAERILGAMPAPPDGGASKP